MVGPLINEASATRAPPFASQRRLCSSQASRDSTQAPPFETGLGHPAACAASVSKATTVEARAHIDHHRQNTSHQPALSSYAALPLPELKLLRLP